MPYQILKTLNDNNIFQSLNQRYEMIPSSWYASNSTRRQDLDFLVYNQGQNFGNRPSTTDDNVYQASSEYTSPLMTEKPTSIAIANNNLEIHFNTEQTISLPWRQDYTFPKDFQLAVTIDPKKVYGLYIKNGTNTPVVEEITSPSDIEHQNDVKILAFTDTMTRWNLTVAEPIADSFRSFTSLLGAYHHDAKLTLTTTDPPQFNLSHGELIAKGVKYTIKAGIEPFAIVSKDFLALSPMGTDIIKADLMKFEDANGTLQDLPAGDITIYIPAFYSFAGIILLLMPQSNAPQKENASYGDLMNYIQTLDISPALLRVSSLLGILVVSRDNAGISIEVKYIINSLSSMVHAVGVKTVDNVPTQNASDGSHAVTADTAGNVSLSDSITDPVPTGEGHVYMGADRSMKGVSEYIPNNLITSLMYIPTEHWGVWTDGGFPIANFLFPKVNRLYYLADGVHSSFYSHYHGFRPMYTYKANFTGSEDHFAVEAKNLNDPKKMQIRIYDKNPNVTFSSAQTGLTRDISASNSPTTDYQYTSHDLLEIKGSQISFNPLGFSAFALSKSSTAIPIYTGKTPYSTTLDGTNLLIIYSQYLTSKASYSTSKTPLQGMIYRENNNSKPNPLIGWRFSTLALNDNKYKTVPLNFMIDTGSGYLVEVIDKMYIAAKCAPIKIHLKLVTAQGTFHISAVVRRERRHRDFWPKQIPLPQSVSSSLNIFLPEISFYKGHMTHYRFERSVGTLNDFTADLDGTNSHLYYNTHTITALGLNGYTGPTNYAVYARLMSLAGSRIYSWENLKNTFFS